MELMKDELLEQNDIKIDIEDEEISEIEENESEHTFEKYDVSVLPNDFNIQTIFSYMENDVFKIPKFQRNYVWEHHQASKLIESILLELPIPQIFLYQYDKNKYYIIDGQQRLLSVYFFMKEKFPKKTVRSDVRKGFDGTYSIKNILNDDSLFTAFKLKLGEKNKNNNKKFSNLDDQLDFGMKTMRCVVIKQNYPENHNSIYEIFNRLNTGGTMLKPQEIRASLYYSDFYEMIENLNNDSNWREIIGRKNPHLNMKDVEMVLRAFSMAYDFSYSEDGLKARGLSKYSGTVVDFLNNFSNYGKEKMDKIEIENLKLFFSSFVNLISTLNNSLFRNDRNVFSFMKFEAVFVAVFKIINDNPEFKLDALDEEILLKVINDDDLSLTTKHSSTRKDYVHKRRNIAYSLIREWAGL